VVAETNTFYFGLFGFDLTAFFYNCSIASTSSSTTPCPYDTLNQNYDGWAVGSYAKLSYASNLSTLAEGVCDVYT
jgi:hypothetical protein